MRNQITDSSMTDQIAAALREHAATHDVSAIWQEIHNRHGLVDIDAVDPDEFWAIVARHAK